MIKIAKVFAKVFTVKVHVHSVQVFPRNKSNYGDNNQILVTRKQLMLDFIQRESKNCFIRGEFGSIWI